MADESIYYLMYRDGEIAKFIGDIEAAPNKVAQEAIRTSEIILSQIGDGSVNYKEDLPTEQLKQKGVFIMNLPDQTTKPLGEITLGKAIEATRNEAIKISRLQMFIPINWKVELVFRPAFRP